MSAINQNRYDQLLRRVADLKGGGSKVNDALTELFPMIDVEQVPAELLVLSGARLSMGTVSAAAGGGALFSSTILRNPGGSGFIARLICVSARLSVIGNILFAPTQNSSTPAGATAFADGRVFGEGTVLQTQAATNGLVAAPGFFIIRDNVLDGVVWQPPVGLGVISPGTGFTVSPQGNNRAIDVSYLWIERQAQPSELNL